MFASNTPRGFGEAEKVVLVVMPSRLWGGSGRFLYGGKMSEMQPSLSPNEP